jgi:carbonic anhydrase/acetyltransferase-like protein (isoleucine patch superfamily)
VTHIITIHGHTPQIHPRAYVAPGTSVIGNVIVGEESSLWFHAVLRGDINSVTVGRRTNVQDGSVLHVTSDLPVTVGDDVTIGHRAIVHACTVGDMCLIGMGAILLDGAVVGPYSLVAAGSVVKERFRVPEGVLVAGVPARIVRDLTEDERAQIRDSAIRYVRYALDSQASHTGLHSA